MSLNVLVFYLRSKLKVERLSAFLTMQTGLNHSNKYYLTRTSHGTAANNIQTGRKISARFLTQCRIPGDEHL